MLSWAWTPGGNWNGSDFRWFYNNSKRGKRSCELVAKDAYDNIVPCTGSKSYCEDITDYPSREINAVLLPNLQQEYFNKVFTGHTDKACQKTSEQVIGQTASNLSNYNLFL